MMKIPAEVIENLKCIKCFAYLSRGPVYLHPDASSSCSHCSAPPCSQNKPYEAVAKLMQFPCVNKSHGCPETVPFVEGAQHAHEATCEYQQHVCPVLGPTRCTWQGSRRELLQHSQAQHPNRVLRTCSRCRADVTATLYRDDCGWQCERCAPAKRACRNQGCMYQDLPEKCFKHELYFCQKATYCYICNEKVSSLSLHYTSAHQDVTYSAGSTWRTTTSYNGRRCLITCPAGVAVCYYNMNNLCCVIEVYIPVPSERLCEFRCEVRVTQPSTGLTRMCTLDSIYYRRFDWCVKVRNQVFPNWTPELDISVDIFQVNDE